MNLTSLLRDIPGCGNNTLLKPRDVFQSVSTAVGGAEATITSFVAGAASTAASDISSDASVAYSKATSAGGDIVSVVTALPSRIESIYSAATSAACRDAGNLLEEAENDIHQDLAKALGIRDFYSAHILDFCEGYYIPGPIHNATVKHIHKNVTHCTNQTHFDPTSRIAAQLSNATDGHINLTELHFPQEITEALNALHDAQTVVKVFYCIAIFFIALTFLTACIGVFFGHKIYAFCNTLLAFTTFITILIPSAIVTWIADHATHFINKHGHSIGVSANKGHKFLALTWTASSLVVLAMVAWAYIFWKVWREKRTYVKQPKWG